MRQKWPYSSRSARLYIIHTRTVGFSNPLLLHLLSTSHNGRIRVNTCSCQNSVCPCLSAVLARRPDRTSHWRDTRSVDLFPFSPPRDLTLVFVRTTRHRRSMRDRSRRSRQVPILLFFRCTCAASQIGVLLAAKTLSLYSPRHVLYFYSSASNVLT